MHSSAFAKYFLLSIVSSASLSVFSAADPDDSGRARRVIEEITVISQKTEQTLKEIPASVTSLGGDQIRQAGAFNVDDIQNMAANTEVRILPWGGDFRIRGFGTQSSNAASEPSVATVVDGVFYGRSNYMSALFVDIDRMEILRGPQGTLFGKNSTAGVITVLSRKPGDEFAVDMDMLFGSFGESALRPAIDMPVSETFGLRYSGSYQHNDGLLENTFLGRDEYNITQNVSRLRGVWNASDAVEVDILGMHSRQVMNNNIFQFSKLTPAMLAHQQTYDPLVETNAYNELNSANVEALADVRIFGLNSVVSWNIGSGIGLNDLTLTSVSSWSELATYRRDIDADFGPSPVIKDSLIEPSIYTQEQQELRSNGIADSIFGWGGQTSVIMGLFYFTSTLGASDLFELEDSQATGDYFVAANGGSFPVGISNPLTADAANTVPLTAEVTLDEFVESYALYGHFEQELSETLGWIFGLRGGFERKIGHFTSFSESVLIKGIAGQEDHVSDRTRIEQNISPKIGFSWQPSDQAGMYGTWSRGYKSGGFNALPLNASNLEFEQERATSFELGYKGRLLDGALSLNAAVFNTDFDNLQLVTFGGSNGATTFIILNAGAATSRGFEIDLQWLPPILGTNIAFNVGYADAFFTSYRNAPAIAGSADDDSTPDYDEAQFQDLKGKRLPNSSKWSASLSPSFTLPLDFIQKVVNIGVDIQYRGDRFLDVDLDPNTYQPATVESNLRFTLMDERQNSMITLNVKNLGDKRILGQVLDQPLAAGNYAAIRTDRGRHVTLNFISRFN
jgi:iron complex outermembrane receptor protein